MRADTSAYIALGVDDMHLRVVLLVIRLHEGVVCDSEGQTMQALELEFKERIGAVNNWIPDLLVFLLDTVDV